MQVWKEYKSQEIINSGRIGKWLKNGINISYELQGMYAESFLAEAISGKLRLPQKIVYLRNLVAFILSLQAYDKCASHSDI